MIYNVRTDVTTCHDI